MASSFYDLKIWRKSSGLILIVYRVTARYPQEEKYGLTSQTRSSANSIAANIAESHGRFYYADKVRILYQARGECEETRSHLRVATELGYLSKGEFERLDKEYEGLSIGISSYIKSLRNQKNEQKT